MWMHFLFPFAKFQNFLTYVPIFFFSFCLQRKLRFHWSVYSVQRQYFDKSSIMCCADYACGMVKIGKNVPSATSSFLRKYILQGPETYKKWTEHSLKLHFLKYDVGGSYNTSGILQTFTSTFVYWGSNSSLSRDIHKSA